VRRSRIAVMAAVAMAACVLTVPAAAAKAAPGQAMVRVAHFSPDASYASMSMKAGTETRRAAKFSTRG